MNKRYTSIWDLQKKYAPTRAWKGYDKIKCDCGHYPKDHYNREGWCDKCGCTWYYPNVRYIRRKQKEV